MRSTLIAIVVALLATHALAQHEADTRSPEAVVDALYVTNSVAPGAKHDWPRFRALFAPHARLMVRIRDGNLRQLTVDEFVESGTKQEGPGFTERALVTRWEKYGHIAHAWSSYEAVFGSGETKRVIRGINSFQLAEVSGRWLIVSILWEAEASAGAVPADMAGN